MDRGCMITTGRNLYGMIEKKNIDVKNYFNTLRAMISDWISDVPS